MNTCVCYPGFMGDDCSMESDYPPIELPSPGPENTPNPNDDTESQTFSNTHIRKLFRTKNIVHSIFSF